MHTGDGATGSADPREQPTDGEGDMARFIADPNALYFTDNGAMYCGEHLGYTAQMTGRDISGQRIVKVTPEDVQDAARLYGDATLLCCEIPSCSKKTSALHAA